MCPTGVMLSPIWSILPNGLCARSIPSAGFAHAAHCHAASACPLGPYALWASAPSEQPRPNRSSPGPPTRMVAVLSQASCDLLTHRATRFLYSALFSRNILAASTLAGESTFGSWITASASATGNRKAERERWSPSSLRCACCMRAGALRARETEGGALDMTERRMDSIVWIGNQRSLASS